jgi:hypothetical protein
MARHRVLWRRYALAVAAGLAAAAGTWVWLEGPTWRSSAAGPGTLPHFSRDGRTLTTCHGQELKPGAPFAPRLVRWDVATGRMLADVPVAWEGPPPAMPEWAAFTFLPDDARVLVGVPLRDPPRHHYVYYTYDAATGQRLAGPVQADHWMQDCSDDGRWFMARQDNYKGLAVVAAATGETALRLGPGPDAHPWSVAFAPGGGRVAVHWRPEKGSGPHAVVIHELPSGRELRRLPLPDRPWQRVNEWRGDGRLYAEVNDPDPSGPRSYFRRSYSFSLADADFGAERPEPLLAGHVAGGGGGQTFWEAGPGWVAHIDLLGARRSPVEQALDWLDRRLGTSLAPRPVGRGRVRMLDAATGAARCELPLVTYPCAVSPDGRWVAAGGEAIEMWAVPPPRKGLWAAGAGLLAAGVMLLVARRRSAAGKPVPPAA